MIKVSLQEEKQTSNGVNWKEILNITSDDPKIIAAALRGAADKYDPPQRPHRS